MKNATIKTSDYLFMQFRTATPPLDQVCDIYYPHLSKAKRLPFFCFKLDASQKAPYFVDIIDLAFVLEEKYKDQRDDFDNLN